MNRGPDYSPGIYHTNKVSWGPCHYYRLRTGQRVVFRANEIESTVKEYPAGAVVKTLGGCEFQVTSQQPERVS